MPTFELVPIDALQPYERNARTHTEAQIQQIAASLREFGFVNPVLADASNTVIAGHGRLLAARSLGLERVPVVRVDHLNEAQRRAYTIADNRLALDAAWDWEMLGAELQEIALEGVDLSLLGFNDREIAMIERVSESAQSDDGRLDEGGAFQIVIDCASEQQQRELLDRLMAEGVRCRALL